MVQLASRKGEKIKSTGKALDDAEYNQTMALLKQAQKETGGLEQVIGALERTQARAKAGTLDFAQATDTTTQAQGELEKAIAATGSGAETQAGVL